jgi:hypothetical protein
MFEPTTVFSADGQSLPQSAAAVPDVPRPKRRAQGRLQ